ncbi:AAA family ATPase [Xanthomonas hortorum]|nr:AAA family ATPase [Xanthomonas hortorum]MCE4353712.1 AAA family ATPase [Xanthomonas hortorum pv. pelargonii]MCM5524885.1 AAA family ATPase [Xanthomonas hortorum pv. pelargonii]MCM5537515.1 AAA family ATPase [Xanthomonas hortorum pv. pelargonii]MCM5541673.1 AAA family ATPase [Xanthomonas hortorum pv. pelargonii]MCM5545023.1 AAA family ATPase [Xanthomonas hortorum pv. pelargonii]
MGLNNIRALRNSGHIPVKKINILVGMNSSGKSTLIRIFPLLKQSVEVRTKGPILWYGRLVDFGSLKQVRSEGGEDVPVSLSFDLDVSSKLRRAQKVLLKDTVATHRLSRNIRIILELDSTKNEAGRVSKVSLGIGRDNVSIIYSANKAVKKIVINDESFEVAVDQFWYGDVESKIPRLIFLSREEGEGGAFFIEDRSWILGLIVSQLRLMAHGNTSTATLRLVAKELAYAPAVEFKRQFSGLTTAPESLKNDLALRNANGPSLTKLRSLLLLHALPEIVKEVGDDFERFAKGVKYIEPVRASVERYYRLQDLAVDEIDSSGANTAMYLHSLDMRDKEDLKQWMKSNLGFFAYTQIAGGNVEIKVVIGSDAVGRNVTDLGFGYSQVLPVVLQLWHSCIKRSSHENSAASIIAIEQPELHLHPRYQALLSDVFAGVSHALDRQSRRVPIFVETHSEHIVNRLGALIASEVIDADDVQIILFDNSTGVSKVKCVSFDDSGVLAESWPLGFFVPED